MNAWSCEECIANPKVHEARGLCGQIPFPTDPWVYELGIEVDRDDDGRPCVDGSAVIQPLPGWLASEQFYECPLVDMDTTFGPLVRLYAATSGGLGLTPEQLGYHGALSAAGVSALQAIAAAVAERDTEALPKPKSSEE